jgi:putative two-component system response regulator
MAIADVYDALISGRSYKGGLPHEEAVEIMMAGRGTQFDPQLIDAFVEIHDEFRTIAEKFGDAAMNKSDNGPQDP